MSALSASGDWPPSFPPPHVLAWLGLVAGPGAGAAAGLSAAFWLPSLLGGDDNLIIFVAEKAVQTGMLALPFVPKSLFALYGTVASIPGGLLMPIVCLGALRGRVWAEVGVSILSAGPPMEAVRPWALSGGAASFPVTVRAPLTGIALVAEMSGAYICLYGNLVNTPPTPRRRPCVARRYAIL